MRSRAADVDCNRLARCATATAHFFNERLELGALVVPDNDPTVLELVGELLRYVVVKRVHQASPPTAAPAVRRPRRPRAGLPFATGASSRLFSADFTAGEVRSRTRSST